MCSEQHRHLLKHLRQSHFSPSLSARVQTVPAIDAHFHPDLFPQNPPLDLSHLNFALGCLCFPNSLPAPETVLSWLRTNPQLYLCIGFHPKSSRHFPSLLGAIMSRVNHPRVIGIGEIGLDATAQDSLVRQQEVFVHFARLAVQRQLPIVLHVRDRPSDPLLSTNGGPSLFSKTLSISTPDYPLYVHCLTSLPQF